MKLPPRPKYILARAVFILFAVGRAVPPSFAEAAAPAANGPKITTTQEYYTIPEANRSSPVPAELELTAIYYDPDWHIFWARDRVGVDSFWTAASFTDRIKSGQRFVLSGPIVFTKGLPLATANITLLPDPPPIAPLSTRGAITNEGKLSSHLVTVEGFVDAQSETDANHLQLSLAVEGHPVLAFILMSENSPVPQVEGAYVRVTGVYMPRSGSSGSEITIWSPSAASISVTGWLDRDPRFNLPVTSIDALLHASPTAPVRVSGEVRSQKPGESVTLRDETGQVVLLTGMKRPVALGARVEAVGYPITEGVTTILRESLYRPTLAPPKLGTSRGLPLLRLAQQIRELNLDDAERGYLARLQGMVVWSSPESRQLYMLDTSGGIAVTLPPDIAEIPGVGSRVGINGRTEPGSFAPTLRASSVNASDNGHLPAPQQVTLEQAMTGVEEAQWISMSGYVRAADPQLHHTRLTISTSSGEFVAVAPRNERVDGLAGSVVQINGVCRALTDDNRQLVGIELLVPTADDIEIEQSAPANVFEEPLRSIASLRRFNTIDAFNRRVRVDGVVLYAEKGAFLHLQEGDQSLMVLSRDNIAAQPGDRVEAVGFPGRQGRRLVLREATFRVTGKADQPMPISLARPEVLRPDLDGRLVRVETMLNEVSHHAGGLRLACQSGTTVFEAVSRRDEPNLTHDVDRGCMASITGVYVVQTNQNFDPQSFRLLLRSAGDIAILRPPPWWTESRIRSLVGAFAFAIVLVFTWIFSLRRRVRHQTAQIRSQLEKAEQLEAELVRSSKLESLGVLAGGIAHDFNNLLGVILGNLSLVLGDRRMGSDDERFLRQSERAAFRARDLTQQLLTFAKGGAPVRAAVVLPDIVREAAGFALHGSKVRGEFDFTSDLWPGYVDRGQISQVVHNIVLNACHAMPSGGVVRLTLRNDSVETGASVPVAPGRYVRLDIRDHGTGISSEHLPRIFDPYFTTKRQGSGLGLASAYSIVKKHCGHIDVESRVGKGTTFHIWLPAAATEPGQPSQSSVSAPRLAGRALIMDDEASVRDMASAMLRRLGLDVTATADGEGVIEAYRASLQSQRPFSVVIIDLTVPGAMGGRDAIEELRKIDPDIRAIVSSGYSNDPVMADYRRYGFINRIPKPYKFEQFAEAVATVMNGDGNNPS